MTTFGVCLVKLLENVLSTKDQIRNLLRNNFSQSAYELSKSIISAFQTVTKPILDQPILLQTTHKSNYIGIALWLVMVMIMSNMYKCSFVSEIVSPDMELMPDTFKNLIDLKFKIKAIFFKDNTDLKFAGARNSVNDAILDRTEDCNFMDPEVQRIAFLHE